MHTHTQTHGHTHIQRESGERERVNKHTERKAEDRERKTDIQRVQIRRRREETIVTVKPPKSQTACSKHIQLYSLFSGPYSLRSANINSIAKFPFT